MFFYTKSAVTDLFLRCKLQQNGLAESLHGQRDTWLEIIEKTRPLLAMQYPSIIM